MAYVLSSNLHAQCPEITTLHNGNSALHFLINNEGVFRICADEIWFHPDSSVSYINASLVNIGIIPNLANDLPESFPEYAMPCVQAKIYAQGCAGCSAQCGPHYRQLNPADNTLLHKCSDSNADMCRMDIKSSVGEWHTIWGFLLN